MKSYTLHIAQSVYAQCESGRCHPVFPLLKRAIQANIPIVDIASAVGVSKAAVYNWCNNTSYPTDENLRKFERFLNARNA